MSDAPEGGGQPAKIEFARKAKLSDFFDDSNDNKKETKNNNNNNSSGHDDKDTVAKNQQEFGHKKRIKP